jgi:Protein of unknown function (DUF1822)
MSDFAAMYPSLEPLPLPITSRASAIARQFAHEQPTPTKAAQVHQNTLAVCLVHDYLALMGVPTDLAAGDSWQPATRLCADVADLMIPGWGRLECRPVLTPAPAYAVPPEVWEDRVGYVVVALDEGSHQGEILGFTEAVTEGAIALPQLQPIEAVLDVLEQWQISSESSSESRSQTSSQTSPQTSNETRDQARTGLETIDQTMTRLGRWLTGEIDAAWQAVDAVLSPELVYATRFRGGVRRGKVLDIGIDVVLTTQIQPFESPEDSPEDSPEFRAFVRIYPQGRSRLPEGLALNIVDTAGDPVEDLSVIASGSEDYLQLEIYINTADEFSAQVQWNGVRVIETFVV